MNFNEREKKKSTDFSIERTPRDMRNMVVNAADTPRFNGDSYLDPSRVVRYGMIENSIIIMLMITVNALTANKERPRQSFQLTSTWFEAVTLVEDDFKWPNGKRRSPPLVHAYFDPPRAGRFARRCFLRC